MRAISAKALTSNFRNSGLRNVTSGSWSASAIRPISGAAHRSNILRVFGLCLDLFSRSRRMCTSTVRRVTEQSRPHTSSSSRSRLKICRGWAAQEVKQLELERAQLDGRCHGR